jgi:hypothetical protein
MMIDGGAGASSMPPFYDDFYSFESLVSTSYGGISGGSSISPAAGTIHMVAVTSTNRAYVYSAGARYSPGAMVRLFSTEPSRKNGHHFCTEAMAQRRADGAVIPATVEDDHYWTKAAILPPHRDPHVPASTGCLRFFDLSTGPLIVPSRSRVVVTWMVCRLMVPPPWGDYVLGLRLVLTP